jgi:methyl-accepting chemotaxis protein
MKSAEEIAREYPMATLDDQITAIKHAQAGALREAASAVEKMANSYRSSSLREAQEARQVLDDAAEAIEDLADELDPQP